MSWRSGIEVFALQRHRAQPVPSLHVNRVTVSRTIIGAVGNVGERLGFCVERAPDHFEVVAGRGFFRPIDCVSLRDAAELVTAAIAYARAHGIKELMVNASSLSGFKSPSLSKRYFMVEKWARVNDGAVRLAMVVRPEMIDPQKFGVTVAVNRRLTVDLFESEVAAVAWLDKGDPPSDPTATQIREHMSKS